MRADFPVVLDACVLAEAAVSDLFLRLSEEPRLLLPKWTEPIWEETRRTLVDRLGWSEALADSRISTAKEFFPEAMVTGFEHVISACTNHPKDRHVLAAAIYSKTEVIVTFNAKDFMPGSLDRWGISAVHPAEYLGGLYDLDPAAVTNALHAMASKAGRSMPDMLARLAWHVGPFSEYVAAAQSLDLPRIVPEQWRRG